MMNEGFKMNEIEIKQKVVELVDFYNGKFGTNLIKFVKEL